MNDFMNNELIRCGGWWDVHFGEMCILDT